MKKRRFSLSTRYVGIVGLLLFAANIALGIVMMGQSKTMMKTMIQKNMLDISNTAAGLMDGDVMGALTEADVGTPVFQDITEKLAVFRNNTDIVFIYTVKETDDGRFVFTVDPDPVAPIQFGEELVVTNALISAGNGVAAVDDVPVADRWGNFYSAFSPIFDSEGRVAGVVGLDFGAEWYDMQIRQHTLSIGIISVLSVLFGAAVMVLITNKLSLKFRELEQHLSDLAKNVDELTEEIISNPGYKEIIGEPASTEATETDGNYEDEMEALGAKIESMQHELERYLRYVHVKAYTDSLTGVGNTNRYQDELKRLNGQIGSGEADFFAVVFDIDNLKIVNDEYGHACGDRIIRGAGTAIADAFGLERTFRIGGDEFIAIPLSITEEEVNEKLRKIEAKIAAFNAAPDHPEAELSLSMGAAAYRPGVDSCFRDVFVRSDETMYAAKGEHHRRSAAMQAL